MSEGFILQFLIVGVVGLVIALLGFFAAKRSGLMPAQALLIATLKDINAAQLSKITELNTGIGGHTMAVKELKVQIGELQGSVLSLVEENRKLSLALGTPTSTPVARQATAAVEKASEVVNGMAEKKAKP